MFFLVLFDAQSIFSRVVIFELEEFQVEFHHNIWMLKDIKQKRDGNILLERPGGRPHCWYTHHLQPT